MENKERKPEQEKKFAGASTAAELTSEQIAQLLGLLYSSHCSGKGVAKDDFAGFAGSAFTSTIFNKKTNSIIDSGASCHMCGDLNLFTTKHKLNRPFVVSLPTKETTSVDIAGTVCVLPELILRDVLFVPNFSCNLISVGKLIRDLSCNVLFTPTRCVLQAPFMKTPLEVGKASKDLFFLKAES